ncbi:MAG: type VII secretion protein EccCa [Propionibacteriales bacterium]|nr:type VII secretion protein EccCa [Propionibacteriales bacterium]
MTRRLVHRPTRITEPLTEPEPERLAAPPTLTDDHVGGQALHMMLPAAGGLSAVVMIVVMRGANPLFMLAGGVMLVVALVAGVAFAFSHRGQAVRTRRVQREFYLDYLEKFRMKMRTRTREVRERTATLDPDPGALPEVIRDPGRLWERRRTDPDFGRVRVGLGDVAWFGLTVPPEESPVQPYDPIMLAEAEALTQHYGQVLGVPVAARLKGAGSVAVIGAREDVLPVARSMIMQLAALHAPDDLMLAATYGPDTADDWRGLDLLPHVVDDKLRDAGVRARRVGPTMTDLGSVLGAELTDRAQLAAAARRDVIKETLPVCPLMIFCDDHGRQANPLPIPDADLRPDELGVTVVHLLSDRMHEPPDVTVRVTVADGLATITDKRLIGEEQRPTPTRTASIDQPSADLFDTVARTLAPLRLQLTQAERADSARSIPITDLLGIEELGHVGAGLWRPRSPRDFLRVPIGLDDYGAPILLDLKESAALGMGPHGICIGATGSGKSEMLRTLVLALALSHSPEDLSMILVDYKGGATFDPFTGLPHVAGIMDNLADEAQLIERARASISGEVIRRQEQLRAAGSVSISHYRELRAERGRTGGQPLPPMPHLFVVIDEFGELLTAEPDFIDLLIQIGRIGRSIGVHLLLSSQRIESGKLRGLDTYLSYRIGLRTFSAAESSVVLDTPDAFHLPAIPGYGYLKVDTSVYRRFRSGFVSGPVDEPDSAEIDENHGPAEPLLLPTYNTLRQSTGGEGDDDETETELTAPMVGRPLVVECVERLRTGAADRTVPPIWLPPLPDRLTLSRVIGDPDESSSNGLVVPLGLLDDPARQRQQPWLLDLGRAGGHHAIIGAPGTGRTTFLRTVVTSLALSRTPREVSIYGMDLTGAGLRRIEGFPHVGGIATRAHPDRLHRLVEELNGMLAIREAVFRDRGIESPAMLRAEHAAGRIPELVAAEVVLLVDGLSVLRDDFEELEESLMDLLQRGGSYGIHLVLAMTRWNELRIVHQPMIGTRFELRLNDPLDSTIGRKLNAVLKLDQPGRVITDDERFAQIALPVLADTGEAGLGAAVEYLAEQSAASWKGAVAAEPIRLLPTHLDPNDLPDALTEPDAVPYGLRQDTMEPALLDLRTTDQHLMVIGDQGSGKTTLLRTVIRGLVERHTAEELVIAVMDLRGQVAAEVPDDYLGGHATTAGLAHGLSSAIATELSERVDSANAASGDGRPTPESRQALARGPRIVVVADDYDILDASTIDPLEPLLPFLASARDLRLHVVISRPVAGIDRAMFGHGLSTLRDTGGSVFLMSGERSEGQVVPGVYAEPMVPGRGRLLRRGGKPHVVQVAETGADLGKEKG